MKTVRILSFLLVLTIALALLGGPAAAQDPALGPIAAVTVTEKEVAWLPLVKHAGALLTLSGPGDFYLRQEYQLGAALVFRVQEGKSSPAPDGLYGYELRLAPLPDTPAGQELVQSGSFSILNAAFVVPGAAVDGDADPGGMQPQDVVNYDDVIVTGSLCVGFDCVNGESFGFDTLRLKENNLRIHLDDTSTTAGFPANDWTLIANDSASGGASYFAIEDRTASRQLFRLSAGAPSNSLYVDSAGRVGLGTSTPAENLHIWDDDTPAIRLDQSGGGWAPQIWDVASNEAYLFIRDVTHGSSLPFRIQAGAPSASLNIKNDGRIGLGTWYPEAALEVERTGTDASLVLDRTAGAKMVLSAGSGGAALGTTTGHPVQVLVGAGVHTTFETNGDVTIQGGVLIENSNVHAKENFVAVDPQEVLALLDEVSISTWNFKADEADTPHMGPMAQDFYRAFGLGMDDQHIAPIDTNGVALAAIQGLYQMVQDQETEIEALEAQNADLEARLVALEQAVGAQQASQPSFATILPWLLCGLLLCGYFAVRGKAAMVGQVAGQFAARRKAR